MSHGRMSAKGGLWTLASRVSTFLSFCESTGRHLRANATGTWAATARNRHMLRDWVSGHCCRCDGWCKDGANAGDCCGYGNVGLEASTVVIMCDAGLRAEMQHLQAGRYCATSRWDCSRYCRLLYMKRCPMGCYLSTRMNVEARRLESRG